jgi:TIR domain/Tetratricopeptide repeat/NB-ARC domain
MSSWPGSRPDGQQGVFFVSHAGRDRAWAEWVAWQLAGAGHAPVLDLWDWASGQSFGSKIRDALRRCHIVILLFSTVYFDRFRHEAEEWPALLSMPGTDQGRLVPVRVEDVPAASMPAALRALAFRDLFGMPEDRARHVLLEAVLGHSRPEPASVLWTPGRRGHGGVSRLAGSPPRLPGTRPCVWNVPARDPAFKGRDRLLGAIREQLLGGDGVAVQAVLGPAGMGKSRLAAEYVHRFASAYDLAWWVAADQPALLGEQFSALGTELGCAGDRAGTGAARSAVLNELRDRGRWLLVFDNASNPGDLAGWIPDGSGHVLITSRSASWDGVAVPAGIGVFDRAETVAMLRSRVAGLSEVDADQLAVQLGDLPLAIVQAAGFMAETGMTAAEYLGLLRAQAGHIADIPRPVPYPPFLAAVTHLTAGRLARDDSAAFELALLCAFLAPEPVPADIMTTAAAELPSELSAGVATPAAWRQAQAVLARYGLAQADQRGLYLHQLIQAILRDYLTPDQASATRARSEAILAASDPGDPADAATWHRWTRLMPHLLAADLAATDNPGLRIMACDASWNLLARGDVDGSADLASDLYQQWRKRLGNDHLDTLAIGHCLAWVLRVKGQHTDARDLNEDILGRKRRVLGADHPSTLATASALVSNKQVLGDVQAARDLNEDILARKRRVLGAHQPNPLASARDFGVDLPEQTGTDDGS